MVEYSTPISSPRWVNSWNVPRAFTKGMTNWDTKYLHLKITIYLYIIISLDLYIPYINKLKFKLVNCGTMGKHAMISCEKCGKIIRSDTRLRHLDGRQCKIEPKFSPCPLACGVHVDSTNLARHLKRCSKNLNKLTLK